MKVDALTRLFFSISNGVFVHWLHKESLKSPQGVLEESIGSPCEVLVESKRNPGGIYGVHKDSTGTPQLCVEECNLQHCGLLHLANLCYICNPWLNWETYLLLFNTSKGGFAACVRLCTVKTYDNNKAKVDYCMISIYSVVTHHRWPYQNWNMVNVTGHNGVYQMPMSSWVSVLGKMWQKLQVSSD